LAEEPSKRVVAHSQITGLVGKVYLKLATAAVAADGFQKTCLFPYNHHIFDKHDPGRISAQHYLFASKPCSMYQTCRRTAYH